MGTMRAAVAGLVVGAAVVYLLMAFVLWQFPLDFAALDRPTRLSLALAAVGFGVAFSGVARLADAE